MMCVVTMAMGDYDEEEHERRERKTSAIDPSEDDTRRTYEGSFEYVEGSSTEELLDQFNEIKSK